MNTRSTLTRPGVIAAVSVLMLMGLVVAALVLWGQQSDAVAAAPVSREALGDADGIISQEGAVSAFDDAPAVSNLDSDLLAAVRAAADAAADDGVSMHVNSGWRSSEHQLLLLQEAVEQYGSAEEAARWVATPENSEHVSGDAVDLGPLAAQDWLAHHGAEFGLCQVYANERWHFELRPGAVANGCPVMYENPTTDPRTQR